MTDPLSWLDEELTAWRDKGLYREPLAREGPATTTQLKIDGQTYVNFASNDYLGLAARRLAESAINSIQENGWGSAASPSITGRSVTHQQLEQTIARFEGTEAALLFNTGYAANLTTIPALADDGDVIFSDQLNHASIIDGCRLSKARQEVFPHGQIDELRQTIREARPFRRGLIVTDALFSMDGDFARLDQLAELARDESLMLMVDEAHATGVWGAQGRGVSEMQDAESGVHIRVGTLSKALGSFGGFVAGSDPLIQWLRNRARGYVFSTAAPAAMAAAGLKALEIVAAEPERREHLQALARDLRQSLAAAGWDVGHSQSQIIPVYVGPAEETMQLSLRLREFGLWVPGIRPPSVPEGKSLLRISLSSDHTSEMIEQLLGVLGSRS